MFWASAVSNGSCAKGFGRELRWGESIELGDVTGHKLLFYINGASIERSFADHSVNVQHTRSMVQQMLLRYTGIETVSALPSAPSGAMPALVGWDSDASEPYDSDSGSETDPGMPPLIDIYNSDSGYGSD
ncbi:hypothetical protein C8J56DRAFT_890676 [Mycena floridula]|nr:hypothetical protein C8J56DRAFT_890676 [Mycena floridula]